MHMVEQENEMDWTAADVVGWERGWDFNRWKHLALGTCGLSDALII